MKAVVKETPSNPFEGRANVKQVMRELLKKSKKISFKEATEKAKRASESQKKNK
ncbi:MAG: hypothetical protein ACKO96_31355 [Flammeovirgaceae bacterium]